MGAKRSDQDVEGIRVEGAKGGPLNPIRTGQPQRMAGQIPSPTPVEVAPESYADTRARVQRERADFLKGYKRSEAPKKDCPPGCSPT